jgi:hypothetical protein
MSYKFETQWDSPNFSNSNNGRKFIVIHWWDDPAKNPTYEGTIQTLCNPTRQASAHFVATGTGRRVACLVDMMNTAWHAGTTNPATNPNPISLGIECDPRCRDEDYDVVAELICNIRSAFGDIPLRRHSEFVATRCPGNWDLNRLDALARTKIDGGDWGIVTDKPKPVVPPTVTPPIVIPEPPVTLPEPVEQPVIVEPPIIPPIEIKPPEVPEKPNLRVLLMLLIRRILEIIKSKFMKG